MLACVAAVGALALCAGPAYAHPDRRPRANAAQDTVARSTLQQTIVGGDPSEGFSFLRLGPGEPHVVREELASAQPGRAGRRRSLVYLAQLTDFQLSDEESPSRVEFLDDTIGSAVSSAWRPQEALVAHQVEYTIRQVNRFLDSPVAQGDGSRARMLNAVLTGDLADNQQHNETEWVVRLLEGGTLEPNSGSSDVTSDYDAFCKSQVDAGNLDPGEAENYTGIQDYDDYFASPSFWDPDQPLGIFAARNFPVWTGLMDRAQDPFPAEGLAVPSYVAFGNHDIQAQGNEDAIAAYETVGTGCIKPLAPMPSFSNPLDNLDPAYLQGVANDPSKAMPIPPDPRRRYVDRPQFKSLHDTGKQADAHGFAFVDQEELQASRGNVAYYSFSPKPGIRYIVIDTVADSDNVADLSNGNIDDPQWQWLVRELDDVAERDEIVLLFGHHATGSMTVTTPDEASVPCTAQDGHGHDLNPGCDLDPRASTPLHLGTDLIELLHRHPSVVAYVAGHSHESRIAAVKREGGGGFWEIKSPAVVDWPPQHRLIEVMDNGDGTLSIFGTLLDHASPAAAPAAGSAAGFTAEQLASIGRTVTYNDPQVGPGMQGDSTEVGPEGARQDRNVELLVRDPRTQRASSPPEPRRRDRRSRDREPRRRGEAQREEEAAIGDRDDLPFTGHPVVAVFVLGLLLATAGLLCRRLGRRD